MIRFVKQVTARGLGALSVVVFLALVLDVLWGVVTRYVLGHQAPWTEELARFLLVWLGMAGAALAYIDNKHLGVDALTRLLDPSGRRLAHVVTHSSVFLFAAGVMVWGGVQLFTDRWQAGQVMSALAIKRAWFYLSIPVSGLLIAIFALDTVVTTALGKEPEGSPPEGEQAE